MQRLYRKLARGLPLIILAAIIPTQAFGASQSKTSARQKLRRAEAEADRLIQSFHDTLDFKVAFDEHFVTEPGLRKSAVRFGGELKVSGEMSEDLMERVYVSFMNFLHLFAEFKLIQDKSEVPPEVEAAKSDSKYFLLDNEPGKRLTTVAELEQGVAETDKISALYRAHFGPGTFESHLYRRNIAEARQQSRANSHNVPRVERGNKKFGISPGTPVYVVRRELFDYYFIEEGKRFKLFYVDILPNFKLF
jgi:hypothetical protein